MACQTSVTKWHSFLNFSLKRHGEMKCTTYFLTRISVTDNTRRQLYQHGLQYLTPPVQCWSLLLGLHNFPWQGEFLPLCSCYAWSKQGWGHSGWILTTCSGVFVPPTSDGKTRHVQVGNTLQWPSHKHCMVSRREKAAHKCSYIPGSVSVSHFLLPCSQVATVK